jgi:hypothetical protein
MDWERLLLTYVDDHLETCSEAFQRRAHELINRGQYMTGTEVVDDFDDENWGTNYTFDLLPDDGPPIRLVRVVWSRLAAHRDTAMLDMLDADLPDDASALTDPPEGPSGN